MELSADIYRIILRHVGGRTDLSTLCRVNKGFQHVAEQALYSTTYASNARDSFVMCSLFAKTPRLALLVESLTLHIRDGHDTDGPLEVCLSNDFWPIVSEALHQTPRLRCLNLYLDSASDAAQAWILSGTVFRLRSFRCDLQWDADLASFLNTQPDILDLYIVDYSFPEDSDAAPVSISSPLDPGALPNLSTLQTTFAEAACALVPTRPISRLKTCFSKTRLLEKREELSLLSSRLMGTTHPLRALDIADSSYSDAFSMELLAAVTRLQNKVHDLRYLGTLVLPVDGDGVRSFISGQPRRLTPSIKRLKFYGLLRTFCVLRCIEVDVSEWEPPPAIPAGMRALASELRLYCPSLQRVIFVYDFERTAVTVVDGTYALDNEANTDHIWREF